MDAEAIEDGEDEETSVSVSPSRTRASSTASVVAFAGSRSVESAAPILISSTLHRWVHRGERRHGESASSR
jgi:hypothetical protein